MNVDGLPPLLMTSDPGSFARSTIVERKPQIIAQVIDDNGYPPEIVAALEAFRLEIAQHPIQPLTEPASDVASWNEQLAAYRGKTWLELPWYLAEATFYRRLLEAVRYFASGPCQGHDPFGLQKRRQDQAAVAWLTENWRFLADLEPEGVFATLLHSSLWGNRADLSNFTVLEQARGGLDVCQEEHNILINHTDKVLGLLSTGLDRVDFVSDNASRELLFDLVLTGFLLDQAWVRKIVWHLKGHPFFVSDAMPDDVQAVLSLLRTEALGQRIERHLATGRLVLKEHPFWTSSLMFRQFPLRLAAELAQSDLVILKGDVNYRRLLDDRHWPHTARMEEIAAYFPAPFLVLRTLKGEIMVGLEPGQAEKLGAQDPDWLINGKRGIIQFVSKPKVL
jgi:uncharacterized protein with ATP-grasp and redox domains